MKTRRIERTRLVPHTVDGETEMVLDREIIEVPAPPVDWDQIVRIGVTILAVILLAFSVSWSTSSIGSILSRIVPSVAAYGAAAVFDTLWIMCTAVQWLLRTDPARAKKAEIGGRWALAVAMAAVFADGYITNQIVIGAVGASVSALAKGGMYLAMLVHARPLDSRTQQWLDKKRAHINGQLGLIPVRRELQRGQAMVDAERRSLGALEETGSADPESSGDPEDVPEDPDSKVSSIGSGRVTTQEAVRNAWDSGIQDPEAVLRIVRKSTGRDVPQSSVDRYLRALRVGA